MEKVVLKAGAKNCSTLFMEEELDLGRSQPITHRVRALLPRTKKIQGWCIQHHHLGICETAKQQLLVAIKISQHFQQLCSESPLVPRLSITEAA